MINLINNEFNKIKKSKLILSYIFYIIILLLMSKYNNKKILELSFYLIPIIGIFICLFFGGVISNEIDKGTFRYYLTKPIRRRKIYFAKLISCFIYSYIGVLIVLIFVSIIISKIDLYYYSKFLTYSIPLYLLSSFIVYLSNKLKSTSLTICIGILLFSFSLLFSQILFNIHFNFIEFTFLPYLDFTFFDDLNAVKSFNNLFDINLNIKNGVLIDILYTFFFYIIGLKLFIKRDIKS